MPGKIPFGQKTLDTLIKGWKAGKAGLTILLIGTICIIAAFILAMNNVQTPAYTFMLLGGLCVGFVGYHFYFEAVVPARVASTRLAEHPEVLNLVQDATLQLTEIIIGLNDFSLMNANRILSGMDAARRAAGGLPFGAGRIVDNFLEKPDQFARNIRQIAGSCRETVLDINDAIKKSDLKRIGQHIGDLKRLKATIDADLALG
jgi:hypothetical protein